MSKITGSMLKSHMLEMKLRPGLLSLETAALKAPGSKNPRRPKPPSCGPLYSRRASSSTSLGDSQSDLLPLASSPSSSTASVSSTVSGNNNGTGSNETNLSTAAAPSPSPTGPGTGGARAVSERHKRQKLVQQHQHQANTRLTTSSQTSTRKDTQQHAPHQNGDIFAVHNQNYIKNTRESKAARPTSAQDNGSVPTSGGGGATENNNLKGTGARGGGGGDDNNGGHEWSRKEKKEKQANNDSSAANRPGPMAGCLLKTYYLSASMGSLVAVVFMVVSFSTPYWEHIQYEKTKVISAANHDADYTVEFPASGAGASDDGYFTVTNLAALALLTSTTTVAQSGAVGNTNPSGGSGTSNTTTSTTTAATTTMTAIPAILHIPMRKHGGLWSTCDTIPDDLRQQLIRQATGVLYPKCMSHLKYTAEELSNSVQLDMLLSLSRSGNACAIVAIITAITAMGLGAFAAIKQQIVFAVITGVCFGAAGLYTLFTVTLMLLRKAEVASVEHAIPAVALAGRVVSSGWAMYLGWMAFLACAACCVFWILLSVELRRARQNHVFSSNYDQICSM